MSSFRWNGGGDLKNRKWDTDLPTDCAVSANRHAASKNLFVSVDPQLKIWVFATVRLVKK